MSDHDNDFIHIAAPDIGTAEEQAVLRVLRSGRLAQGPEVAAFEEEFAAASAVSDAIAVANGTIALQVALHSAGIGPGDEVLIPAFTFAASANAVIAVGAVPVFVDIDDEYMIDLADAAAKLSPATAAVMPVHLYGLMADMDAMAGFASHHGLAIIEDAAQAHLARRDGRVAGGTGIGAFSLYATKNMMTGEGGVVTTNDPAQADRARLFRNHGMMQRYEHLEWGLNLRLTDLQAAIGRAQLTKLPAATEQRRHLAGLLDASLPAWFERPPQPADAYHVFHQYTVRVSAHRDEAISRFRELGVGAEVYYPKALNRQPAFAGAPDDCPQAVAASQQVISLPVHPKVGALGVERIATAAMKVAGEFG